jgi:hypothetical protein
MFWYAKTTAFTQHNSMTVSLRHSSLKFELSCENGIDVYYYDFMLTSHTICDQLPEEIATLDGLIDVKIKLAV